MIRRTLGSALLLCMLTGCVRVASRLPRLSIPFPESTQAAIDYTADLHTALQELCGQGTAVANGIIKTTIVSVEQPDELVSAQGVAYGARLKMTVDAQWVQASGTVAWSGRVTGQRLVHKPLRQQDYSATFAHARAEVCYDIARQIRQSIMFCMDR